VTVVCVHGFGVTGAYFRPFAVALGRPALVPTLRDHVHLAGLADELVQLLDRHGLERAPFVANSMGCQVVTELAIRAPERVAALVLVGPTVDPHVRPLARFVPRFVLDAAREPPSLLALVVRDYLLMGPRAFLATAQHAWRHRIEERLPLVQAPALVVRGARDPFVSQRWCEEAAELLPRGQLAVLDGAHAVHYSAPRALSRLVERFLEEVEEDARER
jgi:2-hydroxy-6-oxonona-2,4-dienedioate hydrolase